MKNPQVERIALSCVMNQENTERINYSKAPHFSVLPHHDGIKFINANRPNSFLIYSIFQFYLLASQLSVVICTTRLGRVFCPFCSTLKILLTISGLLPTNSHLAHFLLHGYIFAWVNCRFTADCAAILCLEYII